MGESGSIDKNFGGAVGQSAIDWMNTAWAEVNKNALGIVRDTIDQSFTILNPRYSLGYIGGFGYKATSSRPMLDHNLETVRTTEASMKSPLEGEWRASYDELVKQLPADLRQRFLEQMSTPLEFRYYTFAVLDNILTATARALNGLETVTRPVDPESLQQARTNLNMLLPFVSLRNSLQVGIEIGRTIQAYVESQGANYRDFDAFNNALKTMHGSLGLVNQMVANFSKISTGGNLSDDDRAKAAKAAEQFDQMIDDLRRISRDREMQFLDSTIRAQSLFAAALSLPYAGTAPLYIGLSIATIGSRIDESETGFIGPNLSKAIESVTSGITSSMPDINTAGSKFIHMMTTAGLAAAIALAGQTADSGLGPLPGGGQIVARAMPWIDPISLVGSVLPAWSEPLIGVAAVVLGMGIASLVGEESEGALQAHPADLEMARFLTFVSALRMAGSSNIIQTFFKEAVASGGGNEQAQTVAAPILAQMTTIIVALAGTGRDKRYPAAKVLEEESEQLQKGVESAQELSSRSDSEESKAVSIMIGQLQRALEEQNYEGFLDSFTTALDSLGISPELMKEEITAIRKTMSTLTKTANEGDDERSRIGIVNVV